ncbi:hypothetical protein XENOCAPTIV_010598, partial [Xenoophorus captivus]
YFRHHVEKVLRQSEDEVEEGLPFWGLRMPIPPPARSGRTAHHLLIADHDIGAGNAETIRGSNL